MASRQTAKDEIKRVGDIVELIGQYVQLRKAGRTFLGLCPFHGEKTPSFTVSPERQMYHCFGCKQGGDIFDFWMTYHGVGFYEALKDLAERYGIPVEQGPSAQEAKRDAELKNQIFRVNDIAASYFEGVLQHPRQGSPGMRYVEKRGIPEEVIRTFRIGFVPNEWDGLTRFLSGQKADLELAVQAGLLVPRKGTGFYDRFRGRVMFPIFDLKGRITGFGGRVLDDSLPKYLNTPETVVFHKGEIPYGLHAAFPRIRERNRVIVTEGYMDFLTLWTHGVQEVVASLGTALTSEHIRKLKGYAPDVIVVFDADQAGKTAAMKSLPLFLNEGVSARALALPEKHDPDTYVRAYGATSFLEQVARAPLLFDFFLEQKLSGGELDVEEKLAAWRDIQPVLAQVRDPARFSLYVKRVSERIGLREDAILSELKTARPQVERENRRTGKGLQQKERLLLQLLIHHPESAKKLADWNLETVVMNPFALGILRCIFGKIREKGHYEREELAETLEGEEATLFREILMSRSPYSTREDVSRAIEDYIQTIRTIEINLLFNKEKKAGNLEALNTLIKLKAGGADRDI